MSTFAVFVKNGEKVAKRVKKPVNVVAVYVKAKCEKHALTLARI